MGVEDRFVEVFMYVITFTESQRTRFETDNGQTSDEVLYGVAQRKKKILGEFAYVMKSTSFDCKVHEKLHRKLEPSFNCLGI